MYTYYLLCSVCSGSLSSLVLSTLLTEPVGLELPYRTLFSVSFTLLYPLYATVTYYDTVTLSHELNLMLRVVAAAFLSE